MGGNSRYEIPFCLKSLAEKQQSILGVGKGTREQLKDLVDLVSKGEVGTSSLNLRYLLLSASLMYFTAVGSRT